VDKPNISSEEIFQETVYFIPPSWQYPEITCARITLKDKTYKTNNFMETAWKQFSDIIVHDDRIGTLAVYYLEERPEIDEGPFLKEERSLINAIAGQLAKVIESKQAEEELIKTKNHLSNIIESSLDGIVIGNSTGTILNANKFFLQLLGYEREEVIGKHSMELSVTEEGTYESTTGEQIEVTKEFFDRGYKMRDKLFEEGRISNWENYYLREDGKIVPVEMSIVFLYDEEGNITGSVGINRDITERKIVDSEKSRLLEETKNTLKELKKTQSYLLQSEKMASVGQLAAGVAHEINNPTGFVNSNLNSLSKYSNKLLELMRRYDEVLASLKDNSSKEVASFYEEMDELKKKLKIDFIMKDFQKVIADSLNGTQRIKKIVADLKNFSRVDQEEFKTANINEGIESTLNVVWNELKYKCTVEKEYGDLPQIYCNLGQLNQVFVNLLINAAQAIEEKGVITISTRYLNGQSADNNKEQDYIEIKISDTGRGIPDDKLNRIFDPFFTTKDVGKGTGLGLSIAYDIIQKHKGKIEVGSEVGKGTTFTIKLPLIKNREDNNA
jgi:PAS domain S-box-containing protein